MLFDVAKMPEEEDSAQEEYSRVLESLSRKPEFVTSLRSKRDELREQILQNLKEAGITDSQLEPTFNQLQQQNTALKHENRMLERLISSEKVTKVVDTIGTWQVNEGLNHLHLFTKHARDTLEFIAQNQENILGGGLWCFYESLIERRAQFAQTCQAETILKCLEDDPDDIERFNGLSTRLAQVLDALHEDFIYELIQIIKRTISVQELATISLRLVDKFSLEDWDEFVRCMLAEKEVFQPYLSDWLSEINKGIVKHILVENRCTSLVDHPEGGRTMRLNDKVDGSTEFDNLKKCIEQVIDLFTFDRKLKHSDGLIAYLGEIWTESLMQTVVLYYYEPRVPLNESQLQTFLASFEQGDGLLDFLISIQLIQHKQDSKVLNDFFDNIKRNFAAKLSQNLLIQMKKVLNSPLDETMSSDDVLGKFSSRSDKQFSSCQVSSFMLPVMKVLEQTSQQLEKSLRNTKFILVETLQDECLMFVRMSVPLFKTDIETRSRCNAIFYSNTLLFAYLVECYVAKHKPLLDSLPSYVTELQQLGSHVFINQMRFQENFILYFIRNEAFKSTLQAIAEEIPSTDAKLSATSHFYFRQCLNNTLKNVFALHKWLEGVLPTKIYLRAFATLVTSLLSELSAAILALEDISSLAASHLSHELDYFCKELAFFLDNSEQITAKWLRLNEINFILKSSLLEIVNRWADGKGLLAHYLTAEEVKRLVQAIFQNNERRANALAKIKD